MKRFLFTSLITGGIVVFSSTIAPAFLSYGEVKQIAEKVTVLVDGCNTGSGVIYKKENNIYFVITARHVVEGFEKNPSACKIITSNDGKVNNVEKINFPFSGQKIDLAILQFSSNENYAQVKCGNFLKSDGQDIYVAGFPDKTEVSNRYLLVKPGKLLEARASNLHQDYKDKGYSLLYNNDTQPAMSGGPVFNTDGEVIGIHGLAEFDNNNQKTGNNYGIPIDIDRFAICTSPVNDSFEIPIWVWVIIASSTIGLGLLVNIIVKQKSNKAQGVIFYSQPNQNGNIQPTPNPEFVEQKLNSQLTTNPQALYPGEAHKTNLVNYTELENLLKQGKSNDEKWEEANKETAKLIFQLANRESNGFLRPQDIKQIPSQELGEIALLWQRYSDGKYGFREQYKIYQNFSHKDDDIDEQEIWERFYKKVGWKDNTPAVTGYFPRLYPNTYSQKQLPQIVINLLKLAAFDTPPTNAKPD